MRCTSRPSVAAASLTNKVVNQDACGVVLNEKARLSAIVVADGLGSHYGAEIASRIAVDVRGTNAASTPRETQSVSRPPALTTPLSAISRDHVGHQPEHHAATHPETKINLG